MRALAPLLTVVSLALLAPSPADAETARVPAEGRTGLEAYVEVDEVALLERTTRVRGVVHEVLGIAHLRPLAGATVRARCGGEWAEVRSGARGAFAVDVAVPAEPDFGIDDIPHVDLEVEHEGTVRELGAHIAVASPLVVTAVADRATYRPGEVVHIWARVTDRRTGRPVRDVPVTFDGPTRVERRTSGAGVAHVEHRLAAELGTVYQTVSVHAGDPATRAATSVSYRVGERPTTDLFVEVEAEPETVSPGEAVVVRVRVRSPSGFPVQGARVDLRFSAQEHAATTDLAGVATFAVAAPAYAADDRGRVRITGEVRHPGYGMAELRGSFEVRPPDSVEIAAVALRGGLVPEVPETLVVSVFRAGGQPAAGVRVVARGAALAGGSAAATVDRHGFAAIPVRVTAGAAARHVGDSACSGSTATSLVLTVEGDPPQEARVCVPVLEDSLVAPTVARPAVAPGAVVEVSLARRPAAAGQAVVVELLAHDERATELVAWGVAAPGAASFRFTLPPDRLGVLVVRASPILEGDDAESQLGTAATAPLLVRPETPSFPQLELDRELYSIRGEATLTVRAPAGAPASWAAVLVRDLAQHQGEQPFEEWFLRRALAAAILDPATPEAELLVRTALAEHVGTVWGQATERAAARDPVAEAARYREEVLGVWMVAVEALLRRALDGGTVEAITVREGGRRRFVPDAVELALVDEGEVPRTLGDGEVTVDMLEAYDPSFGFDAVARRVARVRLVRLLQILATQLDPTDEGLNRPRGRATAPPERWLSDLVRRGVVAPADLHDPWGGTFVLRRTSREPAFTVAVEAEGYELASPGPDGRLGTGDDVADPLARVVAEGTPYARASGEDRLMAQLAALSPGSAALDDILAAYARLTDEALEEMIGDLMLGGVGYGSGGGSGAGMLHGRRGSVPSIRTGAASVFGATPLAGVVREDFPATLLFRPEVALDGDGATEVPIRLADAPTTYLVEVVLWRADGWVWSASTHLRVDQDVLVDAPVPASVAVGDEVVLPLRVSNRTSAPRSVRLRLSEDDGGLGLAAIDAGPVTVPPRDAVEVPVTLTFTRVASGRLLVAVVDAQSGAALDAVRRPTAVRASRRRVSDEASDVLRGAGAVTLTVPDGATPDGANEVAVALGPAIFGHGEHESWRVWHDALFTIERRDRGPLENWELQQLATGGDPATLARILSAVWTNAAVSDEPVGRAVEVVRDHVDGLEVDGAGAVREAARLLLLLAPAHRSAAARPGPSRELRSLVRALRAAVGDGAALFADAPWISARAAAALLETNGDAAPDARTAELLARARRGVVDVGPDRWVEGGADDQGDELFTATCLLALAEVRAGRPEAAFPLLRSMVRLYRSAGGSMPEVRSLGPEDRTLAAAAASALGGGRAPSSLAILVDGERREVPLDDANGAVAAVELGRAGRHRVELVDGGGALVLVRARSEHTVPWTAPPPEVGPFGLSVEGEVGLANHRSELDVIVRNRIPRVVRQPTVEIELPAGAEVDEEAQRHLRGAGAARIEVSPHRLRFRLGVLGPRGEVRVPLRWIWNAAGRLQGLGIAAWAEDRPAAATVLPARRVEVAPATGGTP